MLDERALEDGPQRHRGPRRPRRPDRRIRARCGHAEEVTCELVDAVTGTRRIEHVRGDRHVEERTGERHAVALQHDQGAFQVLADLLDRRRRQRRDERAGRGDRRGKGEVRVGEGREGDGARHGAHGALGRRVHEEPDAGRRGDLGQHLGPFTTIERHRTRRALALRHDHVEERNLAQQPMKLELAAELLEPSPIRSGIAEVVEGLGDREIAANRREPLRERGLLGVLAHLRDQARRAANAARRDRAGVGEERFQRPGMADERRRRLLADPADARDVVDRVAHEPDDVDPALGLDAVALLHLGDAGALVEHRVEERDARSDKLLEILVAGHDHDLAARRGEARRERADDVVRLDARHLDHPRPQHLDHPPDEPDLRHELVGHRRAVGLVVGVELVAERAARRVEDEPEVGRVLVFQELQQHVGHAVRRVGRYAARRREKRDRVEGPIDVCARIDEIEPPRRRVGLGARRRRRSERQLRLGRFLASSHRAVSG